MLTPAAQPATVLDRLLAYVAPQWAWRRAQARAWLLQQQADSADPTRVRERHGERWQRVDEPGKPPWWHLVEAERSEPPAPPGPGWHSSAFWRARR